MADYRQIASDVLAAVGGSDNVANVAHCMTRLRFNLKNRDAVSDETVKGVKGVLGTQEKGGQYQVIIGTEVPGVYDEICVQGGFVKQAAVDENLDAANAPKEKLTPKKVGNNILDYLSGSVVPLIPVLITGALFKTLSAVFGPTFLNLVTADSQFVFLCNMVYNAAFYFMPIIAGYAAAQKMKINGFLGAFMGAILIEPTFLALSTTPGASFAVYGIPAPTLGYAQTLIPVLLCVWILSYIVKFFEKIIPASLRTIFAPFLAFVVMMPIALCVLAPLGSYVGTGVAALFEFLAATPFYWLSVALISATWALLVLTGMHLGLAAIALAQFAQVGTDNLVLMAATVSAYTTSAVGLAVWLRLKNKEEKNLALGYFITQFFGGVGEPLLYGVFLRYKKPWIGAIAGGFAAGVYAAFTGVTLYVPAQGFFSFLDFMGGAQSNFVNGVVSMLVGAAVSFVVAWFTALPKESTEASAEKSAMAAGKVSETAVENAA